MTQEGRSQRRSRPPAQTDDTDEPAKKTADDKDPGTAKAELRPACPVEESTPGCRRRRRTDSKTPESKTKPEADVEDERSPKPAASKSETPKAADAAKPAPAPFVDVATELDEDRKPSIHTGGDVLIKDATILTVTKGTIAKGSILVEDGKIKAVGTGLTAPEGVTVIDAAGLVAMPGIIDTHSHIAVQGGVNEGTLSVVPEVRVKDVVTGDDVAIYRALAGGTTTARLLHGSANTIGGQDAVAQAALRQAGPRPDHQGRTSGREIRPGRKRHAVAGTVPQHPDGRRVGDRTCLRGGQGVSRDVGRLPARPKRRRTPAKLGPPPRVDLRLEALAGILDGSIKIHSHCYRSDEILMLLRTAQKYGVRVQSLQHVLEGYKVAAEIAAHGASASTFSDWWAYKIEAYDAIPYNAALLTEAGASVCIKSDDAELMRHLNLEAAKMVKYGGVSESQALAMITINPARELGLDGRLGSIEVGKDADIVLFNGHPFDAFSRCELALDRRRGLLPAARAGRRIRRAAGRARGDAGRARVGAEPLDRDRRAAQEPLRPDRRQSPPGLRAGDQGGNPDHRRRQDRGDRRRPGRRSRRRPRPSR